MPKATAWCRSYRIAGTIAINGSNICYLAMAPEESMGRCKRYRLDNHFPKLVD
jgi:hypothetical protein